MPPPDPRLAVPPPVDLFASLPHARAIENLLLPQYAALAARGAVESVVTGLSFRSAEPLKFEYMARLGAGTLSPGDYVLAVASRVGHGRLSLGLLDEGSGQWLTNVPVDREREAASVGFTLGAETRCALILCANNSDGAAPVEINLLALGIAAMDKGST